MASAGEATGEARPWRSKRTELPQRDWTQIARDGAVALSDRRQGWPARSVRSDGHGEFGEHGGESVLLGCIGGDLILAAAHVLHERVPSGLSGRIQAAGRGRRFDRYAAGMPGPGSTSISDRSTAPWTAQVVSTATSPPHPRWR